MKTKEQMEDELRRAEAEVRNYERMTAKCEAVRHTLLLQAQIKRDAKLRVLKGCYS
jgi:hypothetical protein